MLGQDCISIKAKEKKIKSQVVVEPKASRVLGWAKSEESED